MAHLMAKKEFARHCGVSSAAVTQACKARLKPALIQAGNVQKIDAYCPAAIEYFNNQRRRRAAQPAPPTPPPVAATTKRKPAAKPTKATPPKPPRIEAPPPPPEVVLPAYDPNAEIMEFMDWPLSRVVAEFGTGGRFADWLRATKTIVDIHAKNLQARDAEDKTISRELVRQHIFGAMNDGNQRLLIDAPKTIALRLSAHVNSGGAVEEAEKIVRDIISKALRNTQITALRLLEKPSG